MLNFIVDLNFKNGVYRVDHFINIFANERLKIQVSYCVLFRRKSAVVNLILELNFIRTYRIFEKSKF